MAVSPPTLDQLKAIADTMGLSLTEGDLTSFRELMKPSIDGYNVVDALPDNLPAVKYPRTPGARPQPEDNTRNAWYVKTRVEGASAGKLKGKSVVLKDNVMLAGVPMMNGASTLEGDTHEIDATIVNPDPRCGRTSSARRMRVLLPVRGSHTKATGPSQPAQDGLLGRRILVGQAVLVALREVEWRSGLTRERSIRMPAVLRHLCMKHDHGSSLYRHHADRDIRRPYTGDDGTGEGTMRCSSR